MTKLLGIFGISCVLAAFAFCGTPARADEGNGPWCIQQNQNLNWDCSQPSYEQCRISTVHDTAGRCVENPNYRGPEKSKTRKHRN
jgi:hypothetical protein